MSSYQSMQRIALRGDRAVIRALAGIQFPDDLCDLIMRWVVIKLQSADEAIDTMALDNYLLRLGSGSLHDMREKLQEAINTSQDATVKAAADILVASGSSILHLVAGR